MQDEHELSKASYLILLTKTAIQLYQTIHLFYMHHLTQFYAYLISIVMAVIFLSSQAFDYILKENLENNLTFEE